MDNKRIQNYTDTLWNSSILEVLSEYIKVPNQSPLYDPEWETNGYTEQAVDIMTAWCKSHAPKGMQLEVMKSPGRTPLIYIEIPGQGDETVLLYGHMDKQPEMVGWHLELGPRKPVIQNDKLYGRGGADDGYAVFASLAAILALQEQNLPHARCVILIEASEESGSIDLPYYLEKLGDRIGNPRLVMCLDSGCGNYDQLWMTTSLRGNMVGTLRASVLKEGVHSGAASGIAADSFRVIRELLSRVEDEKTGKILLDALYSDIPADRMEEVKICAEVLGDQIYGEFPFQDGALPVTKDKIELLLNRTWRPALSITGAGGLPAIQNAGNVSRPETALKLSMRLPPVCDAGRAVQVMKAALEANPPYGAKVTYEPDPGAATGWNAPPTAPWLLEAVNQASDAFFGKQTACIGEGGSIPFIGMMGRRFPEAQFVITGVLGPASNAHGPNEFLHIPMAKRLTACMASILHAQFNMG